MRNRLTDQAKIIALLLLAAFLTNGCQREDFQKDLEHGHAIEQSIPFSFKRKTFEQLKNDPKFSDAYDKVSQKVKEQDLANAKTVMEDQYGFVIDSTLIKEVSSDGYVSYTFLIYRETPSEGFFENLVVDVDSLDNIRAYIVKYTPNSPSVYIPEDDAYSLDATAEITPIDFNDQQVQSKVSYTDGNGCLVTLMCPYGGTPHPAGPACIAAERGNLYWSAPACPDDGYGNNYPDYSGGIGNGGGSGNNNNNNNNNNGGSGNNPSPHPGGNGSGNSNGNNNLPVITDPVVDGEQNPQCLALTQVAQLVSALGLNSGQAAMIRSNCALGSQLYNYLNNGGDEAFAIAAVEAMPDGEVDWAYEVILDSSFVNNPCLYDVYEDMGKAPTFNNYLQNFEPEFSVAHLRLSTSTTLPSTTNAETSAPQNYVITITFNVNNLDRPRLSVARTFIHEMIHAEMFRKLLSVAQHPSIQLSQEQLIQLRNDFPGLYDYYKRWKWEVPEGQSPSSAQHQAMAQHYRDIIEQALREFDDSHPDELYEALAWIGLEDTVTWSNLSQTERDNINQTITDFNSSNSDNCQ